MGRRLDPAPLLGIDMAAPCPVTDLSLPPGSTLALSTDGLVEVPGTPTPATWPPTSPSRSPATATRTSTA
ncbi:MULTISPECIES: SpoIIE family protein phosphatase [unclassified Streptomyces]|nr:MULTISPECIES: SpoIIE family protein phosphatase [unclassified Streptomyces]